MELPPLDHWATTLAAAIGTLVGAVLVTAKAYYQVRAMRRDALDADAAARRNDEVLDAHAALEVAEAEVAADIARARASTPDIETVIPVTDGPRKPPPSG